MDLIDRFANLPAKPHTSRPKVAATCLAVGLLLAPVSGCTGSKESKLDSSQMIHRGSWYAYEQWPHDGNPYKSDNFVVYSDAASADARRELAEIGEGLLTDLLANFDVQATDLRFPPGQQKIDIYAYRDYSPQNWGARSYYGGLLIWSLDHERRDSDRDNYRRVLSHELTHLTQYLIMGHDFSEGTQVDMWFSEGLAEFVSGGTSVGAITDIGRLHEMTSEYGQGNPIAIHDEPTTGWCADGDASGADSETAAVEGCKDPVAFYEYHYPMFHLAVSYLLDEDGAGRSLMDASGIFLDMLDGASFASAFVVRMEISLADYEDQFFELMDSYLQPLAARVCDRAEPGQALVSNFVRELCAGKQLTFQHHSDATLKGFDEPVALFEVGG